MGCTFVLLYAFAAYAVVLFLAICPPAQAVLVCVHWVKYFSWGVDYQRPNRMFLLNARNVRLNASDGTDLGAWHALPVRRFASHHLLAARHGEDDVNDLFDAELASAEDPVVIFLHGNGESRATQQGPVHLRAISSFLGAHALVVDYRGFGDSRGWPSEVGMVSDARGAWDWLTREHGVRPGRILLWGHSLGSGVAASLAAELADEGLAPLGVVLESPFTSIPDLLGDYPLSRPLSFVPGLLSLMRAVAAFRLDTRANLRRVAPDLPILLLHGVLDRIVPISHSEALFRDEDDTRKDAGDAGDGSGGKEAGGNHHHSGGRRADRRHRGDRRGDKDTGAEGGHAGAGMRELIVLHNADHDNVLSWPKALHAVARLLNGGLVERHTAGGSWTARLSSLMHADAGGSDSAASRHELVDAWAPVFGGGGGARYDEEAAGELEDGA